MERNGEKVRERERKGENVKFIEGGGLIKKIYFHYIS